MTDLFAEDYLQKHPLPPDPWDEPDPCCNSCGWGNRETDRCVICQAEDGRPAEVAASVVMPVMHAARFPNSLRDAIDNWRRNRRVNAETLGGDRSAIYDRDTVPAPDGSSEMAVAPTSIRTVYDLIKAPGGLSLLVLGGVP